MTKQVINVGTADKGNGDPLRTAFIKVNSNFDELYAALGADLTSLASHIIPETDDTYDLGSATHKWRSLYVSSNTIYIDNIPLSVVDGVLKLDSQTVGGTPAWSDITGKPAIPSTLDSLTDVFITGASSGQVLKYDGSNWVNGTDNSGNPDKLIAGGKEVVLTGGTNPFVTFPAVATGENITIQGAEIASANGAVAITSSNSVVVNTNALTTLNTWTFGDDGKLLLPGGVAFIESSGGNLFVDNQNIIIGQSGSNSYWGFNATTGNITFPDSTVQTTAYPGPQTTLVGVIDNNVLIRTSETVVTNNIYTNTTDFVTDIDPSLGFVISGWSQRTDEEIELNLFVPGLESFYTFLTGLALGRTVVVTYSTSGGNQTFTSTVSQVFSAIAQFDPVSGWQRTTGRILGTLPVDQTGIVSINFPVTTTPQRDWTFSDTGSLTFPNGLTLSGSTFTTPVNNNIGTVSFVTKSLIGGNFPEDLMTHTARITPYGLDIDQNYISVRTQNNQGFDINETSSRFRIGDLPGNDVVSFYYGAGTPLGRSDLDIRTIRYGADSGFATSVWISPEQGDQRWRFSGEDGSLTIPGDIRSEGNINIDINLSDSTLRRWTFGEDGNLNLAGHLQFPNGAEIRQSDLGELRLRGAAGQAAQLQGLDTNGSVDSAVKALYNDGVGSFVTINTNIDASEHIWSFDYNGDLTVPNYINFAGNTFIGDEPGAGTPYFRINTPLGYAATITTDSDISGNNWSWTFGEDGNLTLPGELHGAPVMSVGPTPSQVGRTVNITPADDASDKSFKFRIDQYGETFTRAYLELPTAEVDKQVAAVFPHTNGKAGFIYTQGNDTNGQGMNDAFNIFYNNGDIKITSMGSLGGLYTWKFGDSGDLTIPGSIRSESNINIDINLSDSTLRRWRFGEDGDLTFPDATVQTTAFTGNAATVDITNTNGIDTNYSITFVENRDGAEILRADVDLTFNSWSNTLTAGNVAIKQTLTGGMDDGSDLIITSQSNPDRNNASNIGIYPGGATGTASQSGFVLIQGGNSDVVGLAGGNVIMRGGAHTNGGVGGTIKVESVLKIDDGVHEKFQTKSNATGTVTHDCSSGHIFYHTLPSANWTVNLTNLNLAVGYATTVTLVIEQSATGYYPNAIQIDGNGVGLAWQGNTTPTPSSSRIDVVTFSILYDGLYTVLGQLTGF